MGAKMIFVLVIFILFKRSSTAQIQKKIYPRLSFFFGIM